MTESSQRYRFPRSARIISSDDFGAVIRSVARSRLALGRDLVSIGAQLRPGENRVRFGFTVGKHYVPRSVDRVLTKRVMREVVRMALPQFRTISTEKNIGMDIVVRLRGPLGEVGRTVSVRETKTRIRQSTQDCVEAIQKKIVAALVEKG